MTETKITEIEKRVNTFLTEAHMANITDNETLSDANEKLLAIKVLRQEIEKTFKPMKDKARATVKEIQEKWDEHEKPLLEAESIFKRGIATYARAQEEARRLAQIEIDKKARKLADEAIAEQRRLDNERKEKAREALAAGDLDAYQEIANAAPVEPEDNLFMGPYYPMDVLPPAAALKNANLVRRWKFEILDARKIPVDFMKIDEVKIGSYVRAMKEKAKIPGVRIFFEDDITARTGR